MLTLEESEPRKGDFCPWAMEDATPIVNDRIERAKLKRIQKMAKLIRTGQCRQYTGGSNGREEVNQGVGGGESSLGQ